jgi:hypothetical protein
MAMASKLPAEVVVVPLAAGERDWALARPSGHRSQRKIWMLRWRIIRQVTLLQQLPLPLLDLVIYYTGFGFQSIVYNVSFSAACL